MDLIFENLDIQSVDFLHSAPSLEQMVASTTEAAAEKQAVAGGALSWRGEWKALSRVEFSGKISVEYIWLVGTLKLFYCGYLL